MLENVKHPSDIKNMTHKELDSLVSEIREVIIKTVSRNGGHLASNLGMVETTVSLHRVYDSPEDRIIFDVGHQCYTHKLLTGRYESFDTLRQYKGISGFTSKAESEHDAAYEGHCGSSLSVALGIAEANRLLKNGRCTVAVVGDGALTNGMIYEAMNNCSGKELDLVILVNDNEMSISRNVGGLHNYFSKLRTSKRYFGLKHGMERFLLKLPLVGTALAKGLKAVKDFFKRLFVSTNLFEDLGLVYLGTVDGHDIEKMESVLREAKEKHCCCVVHAVTRKGKGYAPAEEHPENYHSVGEFDVSFGADISNPDKNSSFSAYAGHLVCDAAEKDRHVCAITAAMCEGTGLGEFSRRFPDRFFDVGIAEEHAVTFAGGLSLQGMKPVLFLYSTFAQRVYDQLLHDISIQGLPMVLMLDRAGIVPGDGITHQGIFDVSLFSSIPNTTIYSPESYSEMDEAFDRGINGDGITVIRYPKGADKAPLQSLHRVGRLSLSDNIKEAEAIIITYGRLTSVAQAAAEMLSGRVSAGVIKMLQIFPLDVSEIEEYIKNAKLLYVLDEGIRDGGFGQYVTSSVAGVYKGKTAVRAIDGYVSHGTTDELLSECGFTPEAISRDICDMLK